MAETSGTSGGLQARPGADALKNVFHSRVFGEMHVVPKPDSNGVVGYTIRDGVEREIKLGKEQKYPDTLVGDIGLPPGYTLVNCEVNGYGRQAVMHNGQLLIGQNGEPAIFRNPTEAYDKYGARLGADGKWTSVGPELKYIERVDAPFTFPGKVIVKGEAQPDAVIRAVPVADQRPRDIRPTFTSPEALAAAQRDIDANPLPGGDQKISFTPKLTLEQAEGLDALRGHVRGAIDQLSDAARQVMGASDHFVVKGQEPHPGNARSAQAAGKQNSIF